MGQVLTVVLVLLADGLNELVRIVEIAGRAVRRGARVAAERPRVAPRRLDLAG